MSSLFFDDLESQRARLRELGYTPNGRTRQGAPLWLEPDGLCSVEELVALRQLAAREIAQCDQED